MSTAIAQPHIIARDFLQYDTPLEGLPNPKLSIICPPPPPSFPHKRLRSCLSPSRSSSPQPSASGASTPTCGSRSTSFSSMTSYESGWKRSKSVRWEGENEGFPVTSYHHTYSAAEYDRTPLEGPSEQERACVLPARGSRCLNTPLDCFIPNRPNEDFASPTRSKTPTPDQTLTSSPLSSPNIMAFDEALTHSLADTSATSFDLSTPLDCSDSELDEEAETEGDREDREWEECAERRRMMFARMCGRPRGGESPFNSGSNSPVGGASPSDQDEKRYPEFEGYQSVYARIHEVMRIAGCSLETPARTRTRDCEDAMMGVGGPESPGFGSMVHDQVILEEDEGVAGLSDGENEAGLSPTLLPVIRRMSAENLRLMESIDSIDNPQHRHSFSRVETPSLVSISTAESDEMVTSPYPSTRTSVDESAMGSVAAAALVQKPSIGRAPGLGFGMERTRRYELEESDDEDEG